MKLRHCALLIFCLSAFFSTVADAEIVSSYKKTYETGRTPRAPKSQNADQHYLDNQHIISVTSNTIGTIYAATEHAIFMKEKNASSFTAIHEDNRSINNMVVGKNDIVYAGTSDGLLLGIKDSSGHYHFDKVYHTTSVPDEITSLTLSKKDTLYIGAKGVFVLNVMHHWFGYPDTYSTQKVGLDSKTIDCLASDSQGQVYAGTRNDGLFIRKNGNPNDGSVDFQPVETQTSLSSIYSKNIISLFIDPQDIAYIGTNAGLAVGKIGYDNLLKKIDIVSPLFPDDLSNQFSHDRVVNTISGTEGAVFIGSSFGPNDESSIYMSNPVDSQTYSLTPIDITELLNDFKDDAPFVYFDKASLVLYIGTSHGLFTKAIISVNGVKNF